MTRKEEGLNIWSNRPPCINEFYYDLCDTTGIPRGTIISEDNVISRLSKELESKLSNSSNPKEREWFEKFQSYNRRIDRFGGNKIREITRHDAQEISSSTGYRA